MNKRKVRKLFGILKNTRINADFFRYISNLVKFYLGRYKKGKDRDMPYPPTIMLELTNKCNLHCTMCPREHSFGKELNLGQMPTDMAKKIIDEILPYLQSIGLTGMGETLFATNLAEVAKYIKAKKKSVVIFISTNANFPQFIDLITPVLPYINTVQISTDGVGRGYEKIRVGGTFDMLKSNIVQLVPLAARHDVDVMLNMVVSKDNYTQMADVIDFAHEMRVKFVNFTYINLASLPDLDKEEYYGFFHSDEFAFHLARAKSAVKQNPDVYVTGLDFPGEPGIRKCTLMWNQYQINVDGEMPPCCAKPFSKQYSYGNVKDSGVLAVINSAKAKAFRDYWVKGTIPPFCRDCHFVNL